MQNYCDCPTRNYQTIRQKIKDFFNTDWSFLCLNPKDVNVCVLSPTKVYVENEPSFNTQYKSRDCLVDNPSMKSRASGHWLDSPVFHPSAPIFNWRVYVEALPQRHDAFRSVCKNNILCVLSPRPTRPVSTFSENAASRTAMHSHTFHIWIIPPLNFFLSPSTLGRAGDGGGSWVGVEKKGVCYQVDDLCTSFQRRMALVCLYMCLASWYQETQNERVSEQEANNGSDLVQAGSGWA